MQTTHRWRTIYGKSFTSTLTPDPPTDGIAAPAARPSADPAASAPGMLHRKRDQHPTAKPRSTLQRSREAPCSVRAEAPCSEAQRTPATTPSSDDRPSEIRRHLPELPPFVGREGGQRCRRLACAVKRANRHIELLRAEIGLGEIEHLRQ